MLSNPSGAYLADGEATGTIENSDPMPQAWMVRFGRTVGGQVVDALTQRLDGAGASHVTVAGINVMGPRGEEPALADDDPFGLPAWAKDTQREEDARSITADDILQRSAFHLSSAKDGTGAGAAFSAWGRVATGGFEAEEDDVTMDGDVTTGMVGFDAEWERGLAGVMLSQSTAEGAYRLDPEQGNDAGTVKSDLTGVYPYPDRYRIGTHHAAALVIGRRGLGFAEHVPKTATPPVRAEVKRRGTCGWTGTLTQWLPGAWRRSGRRGTTTRAGGPRGPCRDARVPARWACGCRRKSGCRCPGESGLCPYSRLVRNGADSSRATSEDVEGVRDPLQRRPRHGDEQNQRAEEHADEHQDPPHRLCSKPSGTNPGYA